VHVPGKIDAVFQEEDGGLLVVDWKTGRLPQDRERLDAMAVQLAVYRLAIAKMPQYARAPRIEAEFFFVGSNDVWRPQELPDETRIVDWLASTQTTAG
jgi:DNA helicase-2/ATP-dependent DNA helicase PcrA